MSFKSIITKNVVSETLSKVVSLLSSASVTLSDEQISNLVKTKIGNTPLVFAENNDIGYCVSRLMDACIYKNILSLEDLNSKYQVLREDDELVTETIDMMAEGIAKHISSPLYELRVIIPEETRELATKINERVPVLESLHNQETAIRIFNWGKLQNQQVAATAMLVAQDKANCFKDGAVRQHDSSNILRRIPYGTIEKIQTDRSFTKGMYDLVIAEIDQKFNEVEAFNLKKYKYLDLAISIISNEKVYNQTFNSIKDSLSSNVNLSTNIVSIVDKIDAIEDILRLISVEVLNKNESVAASSYRVISNIENILTNTALVRASLLFHKINTLQKKLILSKTAIQESALAVFKEAGGTEKMIKDHLAYMELTELNTIPSNGLSLDVVLNSITKAKSVVQKNSELLAAKETAAKVMNLQNAVAYGLNVHYKSGLEKGEYKEALEKIHEQQVSNSIKNLLKKSVDDIALEYLVTLRNNKTMTSFFNSINVELLALVKNQTDISKEMIDTAVCGGVISVIFDSLVRDFSSEKVSA